MQHRFYICIYIYIYIYKMQIISIYILHIYMQLKIYMLMILLHTFNSKIHGYRDILSTKISFFFHFHHWQLGQKVYFEPCIDLHVTLLANTKVSTTTLVLILISVSTAVFQDCLITGHTCSFKLLRSRRQTRERNAQSICRINLFTFMHVQHSCSRKIHPTQQISLIMMLFSSGKPQLCSIYYRGNECCLALNSPK